MEKIITSTMLWQDFNPAALPLDFNELNSVETDGYLTKSVFFTGRKVSDGETRVLGKVCVKIGKNPKQAVLFIGDYTKPIDESELQFWAENGFIAMAIDFVGRRDKGAYTYYPQSLAYCNAEQAKSYFSFGETIRESKIYEYSLNCMRAITYLLQETKAKSVSVVTAKKGARVGVIVLGTDKRIANGVVMFNSLYTDYPHYSEENKIGGEWDGKALEKRLAYEDRSQSWVTGLAPQAYAMQIKVPLYLIVSANSQAVDLIEANKMFYRLNGASKLLVLPLNLDCVPEEYVSGIVKWVKGNVVSDEISLKQFSDENGDNFVKLTTKLPSGKVSVWYTRNVEENARNWVSAPLKKTEDGYIAELEVFKQNCSILAFATASGAVGVSTPLCEVKVLNPRKVKIPTRSIFVGTADGNLVAPCDCKTWRGERKVQYTVGYLNIKGAKSRNLMAFALNDPAVRRNETFTVSFDICCTEKQELKVVCHSDFGKANMVYTASVQLVGDGKWQRITVESSKFKTADGRIMGDDVKGEALQFVAEKEFIINNIFLV